MKVLDSKKQFGIFPMPTVVIGTQDEGKVNFMAVAWIMQVDYRPPMVGMVLSNDHLTTANIKKTGWFSVNLPSVEQVAQTDYVGIVSGKEMDKSRIFPVFYGNQKTVPMIEGCSLAMECKLTQTVEINGDPFFIGKIEGLYAQEGIITDGKPDFSKMKPILFCSADSSYWSIGEMIAKAWNVGNTLNL